MTIKALLNYQSGAREHVVNKIVEEYTRGNCGDDRYKENCGDDPETRIPNGEQNKSPSNNPSNNCGNKLDDLPKKIDTRYEHLTLKTTQLPIQENKHKIYQQLQQETGKHYYYAELTNEKNCDTLVRDNLHEAIVTKADAAFPEEREIIVCDDFREMARIQEGRKGTIKRLQNGPREKKSKVEFRRTTGIILRKLVKSLTDKIPEIQMEKAGRKLSRYPKRQETIPTSIASQMDECVTMLGSLDVSGMTFVTTQMEKIKMKVAKVDTDQEDISFWEELEILNEEDFSSLEELDQMEKAEKELMNRFEAGNNGGNKIPIPISNQDDEQPEGKSPTDNFFIEEYEKMMEEKPTNNDESREEHQNPSKDEEEEGKSSKDDEEKEEEDT